MCGIVGMVGAIGIDQEKMFKLLLQLDTVRGPDSTGIVGVNTQGKVSTIKDLGTYWDLADRKSFDKFMSSSFNLLIGHNRWATTGAVNKANAHPFSFSEVHGVHNGTLKNWKNKLKGGFDFDVDSECLYKNINDHGLDNTLQKLSWGDAYTLVYFNEVEGSLNIIRNSERPLYMAQSKDKKTWYWASEAWMLTVASSKAGLEISKPVLIDEDTHYKLVVPLGHKNTYKVLPDFEAQEDVGVKKYTPPAKTSTIGGGSVTSLKKPDLLIGETVEFKVDCDGLVTGAGFSRKYLKCITAAGKELRWFPTAQSDDDLFIVNAICNGHTYTSRIVGRVYGADAYIVNPDLVTLKKEVEVKKH